METLFWTISLSWNICLFEIEGVSADAKKNYENEEKIFVLSESEAINISTANIIHWSVNLSPSRVNVTSNSFSTAQRDLPSPK